MKKQRVFSMFTVLSVMLVVVAIAGSERNWIKTQGDFVDPDYVNSQSDDFGKGLMNTVNVAISQLDLSKFPRIEMYVDVLDENGDPVFGLTADDFCLFQDGEAVDFEMTEMPPVQATSVCLVMDVSGSMCNDHKLEDAKEAANRFVDNMDSFDRVAIVTYESCVDVAQGFTSDKTVLHNAINNLACGDETAMYDGFWLGVDQTRLELGSKAVIGFTDGKENSSDLCWPPPDGDWPPGTDPEGLQDDCDLVVDYANGCGFPIYTIGLGPGADEDGLRCLAEGTGGYYRYAPSGEAVDSLYEEIKNGLVSRYFIVYVSPDTVADDGIHEVIVCEGGMSCIPCDTTTYFEPCLPVIFQTPETEALSDTCQPSGEDLVIEVEVADPCPSDVFQVLLFYRVTDVWGGYNQQFMVNVSGDLYRGVIPGAFTSWGVAGVDYYIVAANGVVSVSDPPNNPQVYPKQISICPNEPPVIEHTPEDCPWPGSPDTVEAEVTDPTDYVDWVRLFFREKGDILYDEVEMVNVAGSTYRGVIPGSYIGSAGVEY
ncbi:MAG: VWA domain-containing protein, partial [bacterium]